MKKVGFFLIICLCCVFFNLSIINTAFADDGGYEFKGGWAGIAPELDKQLNKPQGVAVDDVNGYIYVADTENHRVRKFTTTGTRTLEWGCSGTQAGQFKSPEGIAVSADGCYVYVADTSNHRIQKFSSTGAFILSWGSQGTSDGKFGSPTGIAVDTLGYIYVADTGNNRIQKFNSSGSFVAKWTNNTGKPQGIAVGTSGNIFIADIENERIKRFPNTYDNPANTMNWGNGISKPEGIAVDAFGNIYVADTGNNTIKRFTDTGTLTWVATLTTFSSPAAVTVNGEYIYVADTNHNQIQKLTIDGGTSTLTFGTQGSSTGILNYPQAMAMDNTGNIYIADTQNHCIQKFDQQAGTFTLKWGGFGSCTGMFNYPQGIAIDKANGWIYVSDTGNKRIQKFGLDGSFIKFWTNSFQSPQGITVGSSGDVYVVDAGEGTVGHRVERFNSEGTPLDTGWPMGQYGASAGRYFNSPQGIARDSSGNFYIADTGNNRIQKFTSSGSYTLSWGSVGTGTGLFTSPQGIAIDTWGYIYVADSNNHRIQKFSPEGKFITTWGMEGTNTGQFRFPQGIIVGTDNAIFVVDTGNHRIQKFTATPFSVTNITPGTASNNATKSVTVTGTGFLTQATVRLVKSGYADIIGTDTMVSGNNTITCTFDLREKQVGSWTVVVYNPNGHLAIATLTTTAFVVNDPDPPTIGICTTADTNGDGFIDAIDVTFSEAIKDSTVQISDFKVVGANGTLSVGSWTTLFTPDDRYIRLFFEDGTLTTSATPTLLFIGNSLTDLSANPLGATLATTIDKALPFLRVLSPSANGFGNQDIRVEYRLSESVASSSLRLRFTNAATTSVTSVGSLSASAGTQTATILGTDLSPALTDGTYSVSLIATDLAGNSATSTSNTNWTYDTGTPTLRLIKPNSDGIDNQEIEVSYWLYEDVATSSLRLIFQNSAGATFTTNSGSLTQGSKQATHTITTILGLQDGATYTVTLIADDLAGNRGTSCPSTNWTYRTTAPVATLTTPGSNSYENRSIKVEYTLGQNVETIKLVFQYTGGNSDSKSIREAKIVGNGSYTAGNGSCTIYGDDLNDDKGSSSDDFLVDGAIYSVWLEMVDKAGNLGTSNMNTNWTYDTTLPNITTLSKPGQNGFDNQSIAVEYSLSEQVLLVTMLFIGTTSTHTVTTTLPGNKGSNGITLCGTSSISPALPDGVATFTVKLLAMDRAGNDATPFVVSNWTYDTIIDTPTLTLAKGSANTTIREIAVLVENDTDAVKWLIGEEQMAARPDETDSRWTDSEPTSFVLSSGDGKKTVYVWIKDKAGNVNAVRVSKDIILDQNAPVITLIQPAANTFNNGSITVTYWLSEELATNTIKLAFGTKSVTSTVFTGNQGTNTVWMNISTIGLTDGATYTLLFTGCDLPGNAGTSNPQVNWQYDITPPVLGLTLNPQDNQTIAIEYTLSENVNPSSLKIAFNQGTPTVIIGTSTMGTWSCVLSGNQPGLTDGTYTVTLSAVDMAGNASSTTVSNWVYDTRIGSITLSIPAGSYTNQATITVNIGTLTPQEVGTISYLFGEAYSGTPSETNGSWTTIRPVSYTLSNGDGYKTLYLWVKDGAGNITLCPATASITLDTTPPAIKLVKPAAGSTDNESIEVEYNLSEEVASLTVTFAGTTTSLSTKTSGTHSQALSGLSLGLSQGTYTVTLNATDLAGNTFSTTNNNWIYDTTKPTGTLSTPASNGIDDQSIAVRYTLTETASSVRLIFTQKTGTPDANSPHVVTALLTVNEGNNGTISINGSDLNNDKNASTADTLMSDAVYEVYLEIVDLAGNTGSSSVNTNWTYDSQVPVIKITKPATNGFDNDSIDVDYNLSES
ncbi:SMP-30/gluconolactonase/LRE family protein, partial [Candidatus Desantisbacteria bacterium]|nr:SMP-30/gluconolactonase/LRE family protein [Candidatus Desantisbacteria bacterium]